MRISALTLTCCWFVIGLALGQNQAKRATTNASPYETVNTLLFNLNDENYKPELAAKAFYSSYLEGRNAKNLSLKLKQVLDGKGLYVEMEDLPTTGNYIDSTSGKAIYVLFPREPDLYLEKVNGNWYVSKKTTELIPELHKAVYPFGLDKLLQILPKIGHNKYFGLYTWQIITILLLVFLSFIIHKMFTFIFEKVIIKYLTKFGFANVAKNVVIPIAKPVSLLIVFLFLYTFLPVLQLPIKSNAFALYALKAIWPIFAIIFFYRLVDVLSLYFKKVADKTESNLDDQLVPLVRKVLKTFVIIVGVLFIFDNLGQDITTILAGLSIGGLAFALAAQDTIKNFFGSVMIFVDKPFQVGDWITSGEIDGTVEEVGFRSTRIRTFRNSVTYVPNGVIADKTVDNHGLRTYRRYFSQITITYDTPPHIIELFVEGLKELVKNHPKTRKDYYEVHLNDMAASSLNIMFYIFFKVPTWSDELKARQEILLSIITLANSLGVNFAFPTQTLHMETFPEKKGNSPIYPSEEEDMKKQLQAFVAADKAKITGVYKK